MIKKKTNSNRSKSSIKKTEVLKVLKQKTGITLYDGGKGKDFLNGTPFIQELRPTNSLKFFYTAKKKKRKKKKGAYKL